MDSEENTATNSGSELDSGLDNGGSESNTEEETGSDTEGTTGSDSDSGSEEETAADANTSNNLEANNAITGDDSQSAGNNQNTDSASLGTVGIISLVFGVVFGILVLVSLWKMLEKLGEKGWKVLIPIYNIVVILKVAFSDNTSNAPIKEEFNFDDNMSNINRFNNEGPDYGTSMDQSNRLGVNGNDDVDLTSHLNSEMNGMPDGQDMNGPGINMGMGPMMGPEPNNMGMPNMPENNGPMMGPEPNGMGMPNMPENNGPMMGPEPNGMGMPNAPQEQMPGNINMGANNEANNAPDGAYNSGPMPLPGGQGPNSMSKQCPNCHAPVPLNLVVCPNCGANVGSMN